VLVAVLIVVLFAVVTGLVTGAVGVPGRTGAPIRAIKSSIRVGIAEVSDVPCGSACITLAVSDSEPDPPPQAVSKRVIAADARYREWR